MKNIFALLNAIIFLPTLICTSPARAAVQPPKADETAVVNIGVGYQLCTHNAKLPPLDTAFDCSSMVPQMEKVTIRLTPQKTAKPEWKLYSGAYETEVALDNYTAKVELIFSLVSADGKKIAGLDGRIVSLQGKGPSLKQTSPPVLIRNYVPNTFQNLSSLTFLGAPVTFDSEGTLLDWFPIVVVDKDAAQK